jgi:glycosyltransferase involved in cell wall biosynthesis
MRIGVNATSWANGRGYGRFTRQIVPAMVAAAPADEFVLFLDDAAAACCDLAAPNVRRAPVRLAVAASRAAAADGYRRPTDLLRLAAAVWRTPLDVFFEPTVYAAFPLRPGLPAVLTVHDAIAERFPELTLPTRRARLFWRAKVAFAIHQARLVLTVSPYAAREIAAVHGVPAGMVRIALEAPAAAYRPSPPSRTAAARAQLGLPDRARWFTYVGGFSPHKRVDRLVRAHAAVARALGPAAPHLLLIGPTSGDVFLGAHEAIRRAIVEGGLEHLVRWTGFLPDDLVADLHSGALALVLPSLSEGFGLPAVEAAACGAPVIATTASPLPELLEGGGLFVAPDDGAGLRAAMLRLATEPALRERLGGAARERAAALSWERAAAAAHAALREAAA